MCRDLPDYPNVTPDQLSAACDEAIAACDARVAAITAVPTDRRTAVNTLFELEEAQQELESVRWGWAFLADVAEDEKLRDAADDIADRLGDRRAALDFDDEVQRAVTEFAATAQATALTGEDARLLEHTLRDIRRGGHGLPAADRDRLREATAELDSLEAAMRRAVAEWDDGIEVTREELAGLPDAYVDALSRTVDDRYRVSLTHPEYAPFMANAVSRRLRHDLLTRAMRKGGHANVERLERIIALRTSVAAILGLPSWAHHVMATRMAGTPERAAGFLERLRADLADKTADDLAELADVHEHADGTREIALWDLPYALTLLKRARHGVDDAVIAEYLALDACLDGLWDITATLFDVTVTEVPDAPAWHPDVRTFDLTNTGEDQPLARFHLDLFPRPGKYGHAATTELRVGRRLPDGGYQRPVVAIVANLTPPSGNRPSLLRHGELVTLFHEFGHVLHGALTRAEHPRFAGSETEADFAEAPSQIMEHWCWEPAVLRRFARHHATGEPLPDSLLTALAAAQNAGSGIETTRQVFLAALDLAYHAPGFAGDTTATQYELYARHGLTPPRDVHYQSGFLHLVGGYDAAVYGYLWALALGDDMYTRFEQAGPLDPATGADFRRAVLERGGTCDGDVLFRDFVGRSPDNAAFLRRITR